MADEVLSTSRVIDSPAEAVFAVLADPARHAAIDGTGWVRDALDGEPITAIGQVFRMSMYHANHPDRDYEMANQVELFEPASTIAWKPGQYAEDGTLGFGGWFWRYDLEPAGPASTTVTLTYDWSAVPDPVRKHIPFPPFGPDHLDNSLAHLADLAASAAGAAG